jgi:hypothetical protein
MEAGRRNPDKLRLLSTGFHQETARTHLKKLSDAIMSMKSLAGKQDCSLYFAACWA